MINVAEILKDCPKGMDLDCVLFEDVKFEECAGDCIYIQLNNGGLFALTKYGNCIEFPISKCVIFPKGKTTWRGFIPPREFKDGDIVATTTGNWIGITTGGGSRSFMPTYCIVKSNGEFEAYLDRKKWKWTFDRLATEEEKQRLFDAIKANGYYWNTETKTLEKLVELNKFDITTLKPFESRVLVRDDDCEIWRVSFWGCLLEKREEYRYDTTRGNYAQCVPYEGNEHLLGKTDDCKDYYKNW